MGPAFSMLTVERGSGTAECGELHSFLIWPLIEIDSTQEATEINRQRPATTLFFATSTRNELLGEALFATMFY